MTKKKSNGVNGKLIIPIPQFNADDWPTYEDRDLGEIELSECGLLLLEMTQYHATASAFLGQVKANRILETDQEKKKHLQAMEALWKGLETRYRLLSKAVSRMMSQRITEAQVFKTGDRSAR